MTTRLGDLEKTTRAYEGEIKQQAEQKAEIVENLNEAAQKVKNDAHELEYLRRARMDLSQEREVLINDLTGHQAEIENMYKINKELKNKIKRLENILYGRKKTT